MKYLLLILILPVISFAQDLPTPNQFLDAMEQSEYVTGQMNANGETLAFWQSWRQVIYQTYQVDLILNNWQEYAAFEKRLLDEDMIYFGLYGHVDALNITERGYTAQIHSPGLSLPIPRYYKYITPNFALDPTVQQPYAGWYWRQISPKFAMAAKTMQDGRLHISMARFVYGGGTPAQIQKDLEYVRTTNKMSPDQKEATRRMILSLQKNQPTEAIE